MSNLIELIDRYFFSGVPSNAAWDLIKHVWRLISQKEWEDLYIGAFEEAAQDSRDQLSVYAHEGEVAIDRVSLYKALHFDLGVSVNSESLSSLSGQQLTLALAEAMEARSVLVIGGHNLSRDGYVQLLANLQKRALARFKQTVLANEAAFRKAILEEALTNSLLLSQVSTFLSQQFGFALGELTEIHRELIDFRREFSAKIQELSAVGLTLPQAGITLDRVQIETVPFTQGFVDRESELKRLRALLATHGFAVIEGMAGSGKTWLAASYASEHSTELTFWYTFVDQRGDSFEPLLWDLAVFLGEHGQSSLWSLLTSQQLSVAPLSLRLGVLAHALQNSGYLLCLDDFHYVRDDTQVYALLSRVLELAKRKHVRVLLITRDRPGSVLAESRLPLSGLDVLSVELLLRRARLPTPERLGPVLQAKTEGIPQFVNMFVAWAKTHPPELSGALPDFIASMPHFDSVWQYLTHNVFNTLSEDERDVLQSLSVFRHPQSMEALSGVLRGTASTSPVVEELARRSLLLDAGPRRYRLHDLVKAFTYENQEPAARIDRHLRAAALFERGGDPADKIEAAYHYVRGNMADNAYEILIEGSTAWVNSGESSAALQLLDELLATSLTDKQRICALEARGDLLKILGRYLEARDAYILMEQTSRDIGDTASRAKAYRNMYRTYSTVGNYAKALEVSQEARDLYEELGDAHGLATSLNAIGAALWHAGKYKDAIETYERSRSLFQEVEDTRGVAMCLNNIGEVYSSMGRYELAIAKFGESLQLKESQAYTHGIGISLANTGLSLIDLGEYERGLEYLRRSIAIRQRIGYIEGYARDLSALATVQFLRGQFKDAIGDYQEALQIQAAVRHKKDALSTEVRLGQALFLTGQLGAGLNHLEKAYQAATEIDVPRPRLFSGSLLYWGRMQVFGLDTVDTGLAQELRALIQQLGQDAVVPLARNVLAEADLREGRFRDARTYLHESKSVYQTTSEFSTETDLCLTFALILDGELEEAGRLLQQLRPAIARRRMSLFARAEFLEATRYWCLRDDAQCASHLRNAQGDEQLPEMPLLRWRVLFFIDSSGLESPLSPALPPHNRSAATSRQLLETISLSLDEAMRPTFIRTMTENETFINLRLRTIREASAR